MFILFSFTYSLQHHFKYNAQYEKQTQRREGSNMSATLYEQKIYYR